MKILSLDTSICKMGFSIIEEGKVLEYGIIKTNSKENIDIRMLEIYKDVKLLVLEYSPEYMILESQYLPKGFSSNSILKTIEVKGMLRGLAYNSNIKYDEVHPKTVKTFLGLKPNAKREEAKQKAIQYVNTLPRVSTNEDDIADAIVIGLYFYCFFLKNT